MPLRNFAGAGINWIAGGSGAKLSGWHPYSSCQSK